MLIQLIVTTQSLDNKFDRFITSIINTKNINLHIIFVNQTCKDYQWKGDLNNIKFTQVFSEFVSLSVARNIGLDNLIKCDDFVLGFPDDDCWYPELFFEKLLNQFTELQANILSLNVCDPYVNQNLGNRPKDIQEKINYLNIFKLPISVGLFFHIKDNNLVKFNERFGIGTNNYSGEETIFLAHFLKNKYKCIYNGNLSVYHEIYHEHSSDKLLKYAYGSSKTIKYLTRTFSVKYFICLIDLILRSISGFIFKGNVFYLKRLLYILRGYYDRY